MEIISSYNTELSEGQYARALQENPDKAHLQIARRLRQLPFAALSTRAYGRLLQWIVPKFETGESLCASPDTSLYEIPPLIDPNPDLHELDGNAAAYMRCMTSLLRDAWEEELAAVCDPDHPDHGLWETFKHAHLYQARATKDPDFLSPEENCRWTAEDNALVTLEILTNLRWSYAQQCAQQGRTATPDELAHRALGSSHTLGVAALGKSTQVGSRLHSNRLAEQFNQLERATPDGISSLFIGREQLLVPDSMDGTLYRYTLPSLHSRALSSGLCPAALRLKPGEQGFALASRLKTGIYERCRQNSASPKTLKLLLKQCESPLLDLGTLAVQVGSLVGRDTTFKEWAA